ncbi:MULTISPECIES: PIN/TRAM domain-containing protein [Limnochorda]|uniref:PIN/TRAM domain-containing protein n=1 Tax=Limnochorda TaxID=1676651 RepID=UPI0026EB3A5B|nr:PIN/TRAM domain-containing protein [Limnochorda pilosa]
MSVERVARILLAVTGLIAGYQATNAIIAHPALFGLTGEPWRLLLIGSLLLGMVGYLLGPWLVRGIQAGSRWISGTVQGIPTADLLAGAVGLLIGLILALLITLPLPDQIPLVGPYLPLAITAILGYTGWTVGVKKREELVQFFRLPAGTERGRARRFRSGTRKILDTSVIIDGRIADICATGFLEGPLVVPRFVLEELQHIADSSDVLKRNRGRRGLDVLQRLQEIAPAMVEVVERDFPDLTEVDSKLIRLAKTMQAKIVTNDFNLNKVAELQGVPVLNVNDLANALKPVVLPGEEMVVHVIRDGKEQGQGVGYLDDGTMIVVDGGRKHIGQSIEVLVTSVLQTSAGRMIFARPKPLEKAL